MSNFRRLLAALGNPALLSALARIEEAMEHLPKKWRVTAKSSEWHDTRRVFFVGPANDRTKDWRVYGTPIRNSAVLDFEISWGGEAVTLRQYPIKTSAKAIARDLSKTLEEILVEAKKLDRILHIRTIKWTLERLDMGVNGRGGNVELEDPSTIVFDPIHRREPEDFGDDEDAYSSWEEEYADPVVSQVRSALSSFRDMIRSVEVGEKGHIIVHLK